jgi:thiamine-phosphate pyrophosphorylase
MPEAFGLYLVLTAPVAGYEACAAAAVRCQVRYLQLRMKNAPPARILEMAWRLRALTRGTGTLFIVNDDVEIASAVDADGVHLGQCDLPLAEARRRWPVPGKRFGLSTHNATQAAAAAALAPDYLGVGPVFATPTKAVPDPVLGLQEMGRIVSAAPLTTVAIGGITRHNLADVLRHGAVNFCVVRAVGLCRDPEAAIRELQGIWRRELPRLGTARLHSVPGADGLP